MTDRDKENLWDKYKAKNFPASKTSERGFHLQYGDLRKAFLAGLNNVTP